MTPDACYTCRRRRIQCDQSGIPCRKCKTSNLECLQERPLRWVRGVAIRGGMRGRSYDEPAPPQDDRVAPGLPDVAHSRLAAVSRYYLSYYEDRICQLFIVHDSPQNPFRALIGLAVHDTTLMHAVTALAARHHANYGRGFDEEAGAAESDLMQVHREALGFKHRAIQGLARAVGRPRSAQRDAPVASVFLLVFLDLLESGCDRWNHHLEGAKALMALMPANPGTTVQAIRDFITQQIRLIETLGAALVRPQLISPSIALEGACESAPDRVERSFLGCPEYLLNAVQYFSLQRDLMAVGDATVPDALAGLTAMLASVEQFDAHRGGCASLATLYRSYQLSALLFGRRVRDALADDPSAQDELVVELLRVIRALQDDHPEVLKCTLWPIFVTGLECHETAQRDVITGALEQFYQVTKCLNVANAAKILQEYWTQHDRGAPSAGWIFDVGRLGHDWLLV